MSEIMRKLQVSADGLESPLCGLCRDVLNKPFPEFSSDSPATTLKSIKIRSSNGCHLCYLFLSSRPITQISSETECIVYTKSLPYDLNWGGCSIRIQAIDELEIERGMKISRTHISVRLLTLTEKPTASRDPEGVDNTAATNQIPPAYNASISQAQKWLSECASHKLCERPLSALPTRLLSISKTSPPLIRLITTANIPSSTPYLTLSHCWGTSQPKTLLQSNILSMHHEIPFQELPKTFQDAFLVTQALGISYLWIDSLCIIQDSPSDWRFESARMAQVYQTALCNISATSSSSSTQGLFRARDPRSQKAVLHFQDTYFHAFNRSDWTQIVDRGPLNSRAWVLQERLLSRCNLHFGEKQLYWECFEKNANETFPGEFPDGSFSEYPKFGTRKGAGKEKRVFDAMLSPVAKGEEGGDENVRSSDEGGGFDVQAHSVWATLVSSYSKRMLTQQTDRLVAISGLTSVFHSLLLSRSGSAGMAKNKPVYLAGLWSHEITSQLLWTVKKSRTHFQSNRASPYIAPSWSWASVDAEIEDAYNYLNPYTNSKDLVTVAEASTVLLSPGELFGQISSAILVLQGKLARCSTDIDGVVSVHTKRGEVKLDDPSFAIHLDTTSFPDETVYILPIRTSNTTTLQNIAQAMGNPDFEPVWKETAAQYSILEGLFLVSADNDVDESLRDRSDETGIAIPTRFRRVGKWTVNGLDVVKGIVEGWRWVDGEFVGKRGHGHTTLEMPASGEEEFRIEIV